MKRLLTGFSIATLFAALVAQPASAALPTPASGALWNPNELVEYRWKDSAEPPAWAKAAMNSAATDSNVSRKAKAGVFVYDATALSTLAYTDDIPTTWAIGYTIRNMPDSFTIRIRPHGTVLDWGVLRWCQFYDIDAPSGCYDMEMVTLHEFGHVQSLDHANEADLDAYTDTVMHASGLHTKAKLGWNQHFFGRCDVARLQIRYELLSPSAPVSTCLDLPTEITLSPGSTTTAYGSSITLTAKLKIGADAIYPALATDPLSGREVSLQRRLPGVTSWTTVGTMAPVTDDTGRYVKTLTLTGTFDWRAIFAAPADEGLNAASSPVSRLTVAGGGCSSTNQGTRSHPLFETC